MPDNDPKTTLHKYLQEGREAVVWKLDGLSEYDIRRPLVPTATNLLGLVKHLAYVEIGYFGVTFGRPSADPSPWSEAEPEANVDMCVNNARKLTPFRRLKTDPPPEDRRPHCVVIGRAAPPFGWSLLPWSW
jgi:hypothetical protein